MYINELYTYLQQGMHTYHAQCPPRRGPQASTASHPQRMACRRGNRGIGDQLEPPQEPTALHEALPGVVMGTDVAEEVPGGVHKCVHCVCLPPGTAAWPEGGRGRGRERSYSWEG